MKFFSFFMAFMVLALSILPCADDIESNPHSQIKKELTKAAGEPNDTQPDDCSPFCTCTCCAGFSINHFISVISIISLQESKVITSFLPAAIIEIALPVWQPPRLV